MHERTFPKTIKNLLNETGLPWTLESRKKHMVLIIDGNIVSFVSRGKMSPRTERNLKADINRFMNGLRYDKQRIMQNQDFRAAGDVRHVRRSVGYRRIVQD